MKLVRFMSGCVNILRLNSGFVPRSLKMINNQFVNNIPRDTEILIEKDSEGQYLQVVI